MSVFGGPGGTNRPGCDGLPRNTSTLLAYLSSAPGTIHYRVFHTN